MVILSSAEVEAAGEPVVTAGLEAPADATGDVVILFLASANSLA